MHDDLFGNTHNVLEVYQNALAHLDLHLEFPSSDKQNLLNYYS